MNERDKAVRAIIAKADLIKWGAWIRDLKGRTSIVKLSEVTGIGKTTLGNYVNGTSQPSATNLLKISLALNADPFEELVDMLPSGTPTTKNGFCVNCGTRAGDRDRYCRHCGVRIVREETDAEE